METDIPTDEIDLGVNLTGDQLFARLLSSRCMRGAGYNIFSADTKYRSGQVQLIDNGRLISKGIECEEPLEYYICFKSNELDYIHIPRIVPDKKTSKLRYFVATGMNEKVARDLQALCREIAEAKA